MPGEKESPVQYVLLFDMNNKSYKELDVKEFKDQNISIWSAQQPVNTRDDDYRPLLWLGTNDKFYFERASRDLKKIELSTVDINTGTVKPLIREELNTSVETKRPGLVNNGAEIIEWSERDGWGHFYLYDGNGNLKNQITSGAFHTENIEGIDDKRRILYFTANGIEPNEDPYYLHLYKVNFDGTGLKLLNPGNYDHAESLNDNNSFFVNNYSRVNSIPGSALYASDGRKIMDLEKADLSGLFAAGYKFPEIFKVKADDGITDLYGVMYKPFNFDSTKKYPILEYVYPGPQTEAVNKAFSRSMDRTDRLAQLGFVVVTVGNRGGHPSRSKWYHNYGYGNLRDYGLADKKAAAEQLADRYPFIDLNRVGIFGHSGGGFMSTAALLQYPDFFKVAVSSSGNHDNSIYNRWWSEKHHGIREIINEKGDTSFVYSIEKNPELAKNLKGHLMLVTGDIDNNVHPANTIRMANALIKANKRFDFLLLPGQRHGYGDMTEYFFWRLADYFSQYFLNDYNHPVDIVEMNREIQQESKKRL
jgi:dipeptidyl aminopeptidase/acylaminoacyl peptidase